MNTSPVTSPNNGPDLHSPLKEEHLRRHSHPRHARRGSVSSDASSEDEPSSPDIPRRKSHPNSREGKPSIRFEFPSPTSPPGAVPTSPDPRLRRNVNQEDEMKRRSYPVPIDRSGKLSEPFLMGKRDREARAQRSNSRGQNVTWKDLSPEMWRRGSKSSEDDREREKRDAVPVRRKSRDEGVALDRDRDSGSGSKSDRRRERDREKERQRDRDPVRSRPSTRHSSHEDDVRKDRDWDPRERGPPDSRSFRERDRERRAVSPTRGVDGRYYPAVR